MKNEKLMQLLLLLDSSIEDPTGDSYEQRIIRDNDFSDLSSDILRLLENSLSRNCETILADNKMLRNALNDIVNTAIDYETPSTRSIKVIAKKALNESATELKEIRE